MISGIKLMVKLSFRYDRVGDTRVLSDDVGSLSGRVDELLSLSDEPVTTAQRSVSRNGPRTSAGGKLGVSAGLRAQTDRFSV